MTPATLNLSIRRGVTFSLVINAKDATPAAVNLTGWSVYSEVRKSPTASVALDFAPAITDPTAGEITIELTDEETKALTITGKFRWDLLLETPGGVRLGPFLAGTVTISDDITQP